jgi:hypothetical protein
MGENLRQTAAYRKNIKPLKYCQCINCWCCIDYLYFDNAKESVLLESSQKSVIVFNIRLTSPAVLG